MIFLLIFLYLILIILILNFLLKEYIPENCDEHSWVIVTGSTDGLGKSFALQLAEKKYNLILIGRNIFKIIELRKIIEEKYNVKTILLVVDFTKPKNFFHELAKTIKFLKIVIVVNNVGISYPKATLFDDCDKDLFDSIIQCNIMTITKLTFYVLVLSRDENQHIKFINISSILGTVPSPYYCVYGASKAYVSKFSEDLSYEYNNTNIRFKCLKPWLVSTKMSKSKPSYLSPTPNNYVCCILKHGYYFPHEMLTLISKLPFFNIYFKNILRNKCK